MDNLSFDVLYDTIKDMANNPLFGADMLNIMLCNPVAFPTMSTAAVKWFIEEYEHNGLDDLYTIREQVFEARKLATKEQKFWYTKAYDYYENLIHFHRTGAIGF